MASAELGTVKTALLASCVVYLAACRTLEPLDQPLTASLLTDSTQISVRHENSGYFANIGYVFTNTTARAISRARCGRPSPPDLEKKVNGKWLRAYSPIYPLCLTKPDWTLPSGAQYRGVLELIAFELGTNSYPKLDVDSIEGTYRLRWEVREGADTEVKGARRVESISNEFRLVLITP